MLGNTAQVRASQIIVYYTPAATSKSSAGLQYSQTSFTIEQNEDEFVAPTFSKTTTAEVTFASSNTEVATVSADGVIALAGATGEATITATAAENDEYFAGTATVTITVTPQLTRNEYVPATKIVDGGKYAFVMNVDGTMMYAEPIAESKNYGYMYFEDAKVVNETVYIPTGNEFTFKAVEGGYKILNADDREIFLKDTYNSFNVGASDTLNVWSLTLESDGSLTASMVRGDDTWQIEFMLYNNTTPELLARAATDGALKPMLYEKKGANTACKPTMAAKVNGKSYNLMGQEVSASYRGIAVRNGKLTLRK